jgi:hypothetical protein
MSNEETTRETKRDLSDVRRILHPQDPSLPYQRRKHIPKLSVSWGQRKLLLSEIQFLTRYLCEEPQALLLYIGAAPGTHIMALQLLFPRLEWHLYDPRAFDISPSEKIHLYQQLFDSTEEQRWRDISSKRPVYLVSDIRTADLKVHTQPEVYEQLVWQDMCRQQEWVHNISPRRALLKFRLPYGKDYRDQKSTVRYLDGILFTQPWAKSTSTETRLVPHQDYQQRDWDIFLYEDQMFYYNTVDREELRFDTPGHDHDCAHEYLILQDYLTTLAGNKLQGETLQKKIHELSALLTSVLSRSKG